ncbi:MAG: hypothetical protein SWZ49_16460 [Cyanobacteriota bacterium]|nr:hypothetical protein [Cyanobacteriota bacterium]
MAKLFVYQGFDDILMIIPWFLPKLRDYGEKPQRRGGRRGKNIERF